MTTQKTFKQRVRARMAKTGESYTAARHQLLRKTEAPDESSPPGPQEPTATPEPAAPVTPTDDAPARATAPTPLSVSDEAMVRGTGRSHEEWFSVLDAWGATEHRHPEIARWLQETHGVGGWWAQSITVDYERARGMRQRHQMAGGYSISANRTVGVDAERLLAAFTSDPLRQRWLPDAPMRQRPTRAAMSARFDWSDPPSRVVVTVTPKGGDDKATVAVEHEQLPDAETADRLKVAWRERLGVLKEILERG